MDEIVKKLGHGVRLKIGALADGYAAEFDREDLDETDSPAARATASPRRRLADACAAALKESNNE